MISSFCELGIEIVVSLSSKSASSSVSLAIISSCQYCYLKVLALTVVCILLRGKPLFATWSAFSLPGIPVWVGIQLIVGLCVNVDVVFLMALVIVFKSSFLLV